MVSRYTGSAATRNKQGGFSATHKQDFNAHITGGDWRHEAGNIDLNPAMSGHTNLREFLQTTVASGLSSVLSVDNGADGYNIDLNLGSYIESSDGNVDLRVGSGFSTRMYHNSVLSLDISDDAITYEPTVHNFQIETASSTTAQTSNLWIRTGSTTGHPTGAGSGYIDIKTGAGSGANASGSITISTAAGGTSTVGSGSIGIQTGNGNSGVSGDLTIGTGYGQSGGSGSIDIYTGTGDSGDSGDLTIRTGTPGTATGDIRLIAGGTAPLLSFGNTVGNIGLFTGDDSGQGVIIFGNENTGVGTTGYVVYKGLGGDSPYQEVRQYRSGTVRIISYFGYVDV